MEKYNKTSTSSTKNRTKTTISPTNNSKKIVNPTNNSKKNESKKQDSTNSLPLTDEEKATLKMKKIAKSFERIDKDINKSMILMASTMKEDEIIDKFNQAALDFFTFAIDGTKRLGKEKEYGFKGYLSLYNRAVSSRKNLPIDQFTYVVLEFAPDIYDKNETFFLEMSIPDGNIKINDGIEDDNQFNMIKSDKFKKLWITLNDTDKTDVKNKIIELTMYAHAYFLFSLLEAEKNNSNNAITK